MREEARGHCDAGMADPTGLADGSKWLQRTHVACIMAANVLHEGCPVPDRKSPVPIVFVAPDPGSVIREKVHLEGFAGVSAVPIGLWTGGDPNEVGGL